MEREEKKISKKKSKLVKSTAIEGAATVIGITGGIIVIALTDNPIAAMSVSNILTSAIRNILKNTKNLSKIVKSIKKLKIKFNKEQISTLKNKNDDPSKSFENFGYYLENKTDNENCSYLVVDTNNSEVHHYEEIPYNLLELQNKRDFPTNSRNSLENYYDTPYESYESQTEMVNGHSSLQTWPVVPPRPLVRNASCSQTLPVVSSKPLSRNASFSKVPPVVPPRPLVRNASCSQTLPVVSSKPLSRNASCSKVPPVVPPRPLVRNVNNLSTNYYDTPYESYESQIKHGNANFLQKLSESSEPQFWNSRDVKNINSENNCETTTFLQVDNPKKVPPAIAPKPLNILHNWKPSEPQFWNSRDVKNINSENNCEDTVSFLQKKILPPVAPKPTKKYNF